MLSQLYIHGSSDNSLDLYAQLLNTGGGGIKNNYNELRSPRAALCYLPT